MTNSLKLRILYPELSIKEIDELYKEFINKYTEVSKYDYRQHLAIYSNFDDVNKMRYVENFLIENKKEFDGSELLELGIEYRLKRLTVTVLKNFGSWKKLVTQNMDFFIYTITSFSTMKGNDVVKFLLKRNSPEIQKHVNVSGVLESIDLKRLSYKDICNILGYKDIQLFSNFFSSVSLFKKFFITKNVLYKLPGTPEDLHKIVTKKKGCLNEYRIKRIIDCGASYKIFIQKIKTDHSLPYRYFIFNNEYFRVLITDTISVEQYLPYKFIWIRFSSTTTPELYNDKVTIKMWCHFVYFYFGTEYFIKFDIMERTWFQEDLEIQGELIDFIPIKSAVLLLVKTNKLQIFVTMRTLTEKLSEIEIPETHDIFKIMLQRLDLLIVTGSSDPTQTKRNFYKARLDYSPSKKTIAPEPKEFSLAFSGFFHNFRLISTTNSYHYAKDFYFFDKTGLLFYNGFGAKVSRIESINFSRLGNVLEIPAQNSED